VKFYDPVTDEVRDKILNLFLAGHGVNHVCFLLDYRYCIDDVNAVIRAALAEVRSKVEEH
jgi:hypothetical protein